MSLRSTAAHNRTLRIDVCRCVLRTTQRAVMTMTRLTSSLVLAGFTSAANAYEYRTRFVERVGSADRVISGNLITVSDGAPTPVRFQVGVFDDEASAAPAGGLLGWNAGRIAVNSNAFSHSHETRTPGRLGPWNAARSPNANGNPPIADGGDPFNVLTEIGAFQGTQARPWPDGERPPVVVRGLNTYASLYEITIDPAEPFWMYSIEFGGDLLAIDEWVAVNDDPPDPDEGTPGTVIYAPFPTRATAFETSLFVQYIPSPSSAALLGLGGVIAIRRRRRHVLCSK